MNFKCLFGHKWEEIAPEDVEISRGTLLPSHGYLYCYADWDIRVVFDRKKCSVCGKIKEKVKSSTFCISRRL